MNELAKKLKLEDLSPIEIAYNTPIGINLKNVPKGHQTEDLARFVCSKDGIALQYVSKKIITQEICEVAIKQNGLALEYVPEKLISYELCRLAIEENGRALQFVPKDMKTLELVSMAIVYHHKDIYRYADDTDETYEKRKQKILENENTEDTDINYRYPILFAPISLLSDDLIYTSIKYSPLSFKDIPKKKKTKELIDFAISLNGYALKYVSIEEQTKELINVALSNQPLAIQYANKKYITQEICDELFKKDYSCFPYFPKEYITTDMCLYLINTSNRFNIEELPMSKLIEKYGTSDINLITFDDFPNNMQSNKKILDAIIKQCNNDALPLLNWNTNTIKRRNKFKEYELWNNKTLKMPANKRGDEIFPLKKAILNYIAPKVIFPPEKTNSLGYFSQKTTDINDILQLSKQNQNKYIENSIMGALEDIESKKSLVKTNQKQILTYDFSEDDSSQKIYYISDIHLEHHFLGNTKLQKLLNKANSNEEKQVIFNNWLDSKITEMIADANTDSLLLIGGDVASSVELEQVFYEHLNNKWSGTIVAVLGNHELWNGTTPNDWLNPNFKSQTVEEIVYKYKNAATKKIAFLSDSFSTHYLLENDVFVNYKGRKNCVISKDDILSTSNEVLTDFFSACTNIVIGGIGYSGLDKNYNAEVLNGKKNLIKGNGLYRKAITDIEEDIKRSQAFEELYNKVLKCTKNKKVIVLTHTPVNNWNSGLWNPNCIYVNGHTHTNSITNIKDTVTILSDNQIGYGFKKVPNTEPAKKVYTNPIWKLNAFEIDMLWYNPFSNYNDGIYNITSEQYKDFNISRGIQSKGCNYNGLLLMLKKDDMYMFILQSTNGLCLLDGGSRKKLNNSNVNYYFNNMTQYNAKVKELTKPYQTTMLLLSKELKKFGADGKIHGCIIDVSYFSHIYVNPLDGKITVYWALDTMSRIIFNSFQELLERKEPHLLLSFNKYLNNKQIPIIEKYIVQKNQTNQKKQKGQQTENNSIALVPQWMFGTEIYKASKIMKSFQYVWEQNIIRIWNDSILNLNTTSQISSHELLK